MVFELTRYAAVGGFCRGRVQDWWGAILSVGWLASIEDTRNKRCSQRKKIGRNVVGLVIQQFRPIAVLRIVWNKCDLLLTRLDLDSAGQLLVRCA